MRIEVKYEPSTYLGRKMLMMSTAELLSGFGEPTRTANRKNYYKLHFAKCIAREDNITDIYGSNFHD